MTVGQIPSGLSPYSNADATVSIGRYSVRLSAGYSSTAAQRR